MLVAGFGVKARIFYLNLKKEGKNVPVTAKESFVDEETILWIVSFVIDILGNIIAPIDEALVKVIKEVRKTLEEKDLSISIMKGDMAAFLEQRNQIKEKYEKALEDIDQLITANGALLEKYEKALEDIGQLITENDALKEERKLLKEEIKEYKTEKISES